MSTRREWLKQFGALVPVALVPVKFGGVPEDLPDDIKALNEDVEAWERGTPHNPFAFDEECTLVDTCGNVLLRWQQKGEWREGVLWATDPVEVVYHADHTCWLSHIAVPVGWPDPQLPPLTGKMPITQYVTPGMSVTMQLHQMVSIS